MYKIFLYNNDVGACGYYRSVLPHHHCHRELRERGIYLKCASRFDLAEQFDTYIFQRVPHPEFILQLLDLRENRKQIVWDFDDNLFEVPESSPAAKGIDATAKRNMLHAIKIADIVTVSTAYLGQSLGVGWKTVVLPNLIDPADYDASLARPKHRDRDDDRPITILWAGSITHREDLRQLVTGVNDIVRDYGDRVRFVFFGDIVPELTGHPVHQVTYISQVPLSYYPAILELVRPDLALAPIVNSEFNRCKSPIKFFEMSLAGAAVIASHVGPYRATITHDINGLLVGVHERWTDAVRRLIDRPAERERLATAGRDLTLRKHSWESDARRDWLEFFCDLAARHGEGS